MQITPISAINTLNYQKYKNKDKLPVNSKDEILKRYAALSQLLFDALVPFVDAYEKQDSAIGDSDLDNEQAKHLCVQLGEIRKAQAVLRMATTDIYA